MKTRLLLSIIAIIAIVVSIPLYFVIQLQEFKVTSNDDSTQESKMMHFQMCADLFDRIYEEFKAQPSCVNETDATCEPPLFEPVIQNNEEFYREDCGIDLENWAYLSDYNDVAWATLGDRFEIRGLKRVYSPDEPIIVSVEKHGYKRCNSPRAEVIDRLNDKVVWQKEFSNSCVVLEPAKYQSFTYRITTENNPLRISEVSDYYLHIYVQDEKLRGHFSIRE